jgi:hypothetical protein
MKILADILNVPKGKKDGVPLQELLDIKFKYIFGYDSIIKAIPEFYYWENKSIKRPCTVY